MIEQIPPAFLERMVPLLGDEYADFIACYGQPPVSGLRVNTLKLSPNEYLQLNTLQLSPIEWCPAAFNVPENTQPGKHPHHAAGLYYLQDPSAMLAAETLAPLPGERVLDLAAAPGGKSTHLAALMQGQGQLIANEIHPRRVWELAQNLERWGAVNVTITNEKPERLADHFGAAFDKVLLDAPCSGEGMFRKSQAARQAWSPALVESCARRQAALIDQAARLVRPGGRLLYTTCTFSPEENEGVIAGFLGCHPQFELVEINQHNGFGRGFSSWSDQMGRSVRLWPQRIRGEGHFLALLQRSSGEPSHPNRRRPAPLLASESRRQFSQFAGTHLTGWSSDGEIAQHGTYLYRPVSNGLDLGNVHVIHPGLWLGTLKKNRFEPSQALAMSLRTEQAVHTVILDEVGARDYLYGQSLPDPEKQAAWVLVTIDNFPLGWGKSSQGIVKNYYPHGLRWQGQ